MLEWGGSPRGPTESPNARPPPTRAATASRAASAASSSSAPGSGAAPAAWSASRGSRSRRVAVSVSEGTTDAHSGLQNGLGLELESGDLEVGHARRHVGDQGLSV